MKKKILIALTLILIAAFTANSFFSMQAGYNMGTQNGAISTLNAVQGVLSDHGIAFQYTNLGNGAYNLTVFGTDNSVAKTMKVSCDFTIDQYRHGILIASGHHAAQLTNQGANYFAQQASSNTYASTTQICRYISMSASAAGLGASSTILPSEITNDGLARVAGSFTSTGTGTWTVYNLFTDATAGNSPLVWGLSWQSASDTTNILGGSTITAGNNLVWYDTGPGTKALAVGDTLAVTASMSIS